MAYAAWSVSFGEQPSASKWNILGTNDASFNDGTGIADAAIKPNHFLAGGASNWQSVSWTPTYGGFSAAPSTIMSRYWLLGKLCFFSIWTGLGTSNANTFTITLPVTAATIASSQWRWPAHTYNNSVLSTTFDNVSISSAGTTMVLAHNDSNTGWTAAGTKGAGLQGFYETA